MLIRKANNSDLPEIRELILSIWNDEYQLEFNLEDYPEMENIEKNYSNDYSLFLIAENDKGQIIASIAYQSISYDSYILKRMYVNKNQRNNGIAQKLLNELQRTLIERNSTYDSVFLYLCAQKSQAKAAINFYLKNDFIPIEKLNFPTSISYFDQADIFMRKKLRIK